MHTQNDILISFDPESGWYSVEVPDLPGCYSQGRTVEEAEANNAPETIELRLEGIRELGRQPPAPSSHLLRAVKVAVA